MELLSALSGMVLFLGLCLDFPRQIMQSYWANFFGSKTASLFALELNPNQN